MKVQLIVVQGKPEGKVIPLLQPKFKIGRGETCHLRPSSEQVSREHAEFTVGPTGVTLTDLGSRNGTLVNGKAITETYTLKDRDLVQIGSLTFAVSIEDAPAATPRASVSAPGSKPARPASPDDVTHDEIESWLVGDSANPVPERPSGVYGGDTITITAFKDAASPKPAAAAPTPAPAPPSPKPATATAPSPAPAPTAPKPVAASAPAPPQPPPPPAPATPPPAATRPAAAAPPPAPPQQARSAMPDFEDMEFEALPEGLGDVEEFQERDTDEISDDSSESDVIPEEFVDESNPFYVKKGGKEPESPSKASYKDSSDAASDILRKMMERKRPK